MNILHTADWHLGKRLDKFSRLEEQREVLQEMLETANREEIDVVLIAGDLFDAFNPSAEASELLYQTLKQLTREGTRLVVAIAGNHDSPDRINAPDPLARSCGILFAGYPDIHFPLGEVGKGMWITKSEPGFVELQLPQYNYPLRLLLTPYANEYRLKTYLGHEEEEELRALLGRHWQRLADQHCDEQGVNILMAHLFFMKRGERPPEEPEDEKPILHIGGAQAVFSELVPDQVQYVALGHLHRYQEIDGNRMPIVYSSSILGYNFAEAGQKKYVVKLVTAPKQPAEQVLIPLVSGKPLHRKRFENLDLALQWLSDNQDSWVELTIVSENYLHASDLQRLYQAHEGIVSIIPEIRGGLLMTEEETRIDLNQSMEELFIQYFKSKHGAAPNEDLLNLFKEIRAEERII